MSSGKKWPPLPQGTWVETTRENPAIDDWTSWAQERRKWGTGGRIVDHHDSHGLCYDVDHLDGTVGCYDPSEFEVI